MAFDGKSLDDYVDVAERIAIFRQQYPEGSLQPADIAQPYRIETIKGFDKNGNEIAQTFIVYAAAAYRTPLDERPGIGLAYEIFPGRTPYTRGSELMNAETSAWGRAIIAVGAADSRAGIASQQEVRNRQAEREDGRNKDGSKPRRGVPDEQFEAEGRMTRQQSADHGRLAKETQENPKKAERHRGPVEEDPWADGNGMVNRPQLKRIGDLFDQAQWSDEADRLRAASQIAGRELKNAYDLSKDEAEQLIAALLLVCQSDDPAQRLSDLVAQVAEQEGGQS
jgi:hypothetical protein